MEGTRLQAMSLSNVDRDTLEDIMRRDIRSKNPIS